MSDDRTWFVFHPLHGRRSFEDESDARAHGNLIGKDMGVHAVLWSEVTPCASRGDLMPGRHD